MSDDPTDTGKDVPADAPAQEVNTGKADASAQDQQVDGIGGGQEATAPASAPMINGSGQPDAQGQSGEQVAQQGCVEVGLFAMIVADTSSALQHLLSTPEHLCTRREHLCTHA